MILYGRIGRPLEKKVSAKGVESYLLTIAGNNERGTGDTNWYLVRAYLDELDADMLGKGVFVRVPMGRLSSYAQIDNRTQQPVARMVIATWQIDQIEPSEAQLDSKKIEAIVTGQIASPIEQTLTDEGELAFEFDLVENHTRKPDGSATQYKVTAVLPEELGATLKRGMVIKLTGKPIPRHYENEQGELKSIIHFRAISGERIMPKKKTGDAA